MSGTKQQQQLSKVNTARLTSDERTSLDHSGTFLKSLAEFDSSPSQDGGNENHFTQNQRLFSDNQNR